ncbi:pseudouridine-5'-phosphate glycosidase [Clostridia bacterium]|nr:pseudouridine-5'-phosphate glycosidase [Clostridia bacterium]
MNLTDGNKTINFLVETALLGHGLVSIEDDLIISLFPKDAQLAWIENGEIKIDTISKFILARKQYDLWKRFDGEAVLKHDYKGENAFLTASGTMAVAQKMNCQVVVTAGIGGIGDIKEEQCSYDLPALSEMGITLVATSPKDMLDIRGTLNWLHENQVHTYGFNTEVCTGYIFELEPIYLEKEITEADLMNIIPGCNLILNPILPDKRLNDATLLEGGIDAGKKAENIGEAYHPAANAFFDRSSKGYSSLIQLKALIENINIAKNITL